MKRKFLLLMLALIAMATTARAQVVLNETNFPDANFRAALASILEISEGDEITEAKIAATTSLDVSKSWNTPAEEKIADLTGIEHFTALTELRCAYNQLTALDVSKNTALTDLDCDENQLTSLDVSKNTALTKLWCAYNQLTSLDVSKNTALTYLSCYNNQLTLLDVSKNTALTRLLCYNNPLTTLDVSQNTALTDLYCHNNQLTALDVSQNTALTSLACSGNQLTALDVSKNIKLWYLYCDNNQLTSLDVSKNTALTNLWCHSNQIKGEAMDALVASLPTVSNGSFEVIDTKDENEGNICTKAQVAVAKGKGWKVYDYNGGNYPYPEYKGSDPVESSCPDDNHPHMIDLGLPSGTKWACCNLGAAKPKDFGGYYAWGETIEKDSYTWETYIHCDGTKETCHNIGTNIAGTQYDVAHAKWGDKWQIPSEQEIIELIDNCSKTWIAYEGIYYKGPNGNSIFVPSRGSGWVDADGSNHGNYWTANLSDENFIALNWFVWDSCYPAKWNNDGRESGFFVRPVSTKEIDPVAGKLLLNAENFPDANFRAALASILGISEGDEITEAKIAATTELWVYEKSIADLTGIEHFTALKTLSCGYNQLTSLDVSKNTALTTLYCNSNQLTSLDVSKNTALTTLYCNSNQLTSLDVSNNIALTELWCFRNQIKGEAMDALVASLPTVEYGEFYVINTKDTNEGNVCTKSQVAIAKEKGWTVYDYNYDGINWIGPVEYEGSEDATGKLLLNAENFPDANFRAALATWLAISEGDEITEAIIAATTMLSVPSKQIADLTGIEHFTALTRLACGYNQLTALDVSKNTELTGLLCQYNQLTALDVSKNTALTSLNCGYNQLTSLDVSKNTTLEWLYCYNNQLTALDVSKNTALTRLDCYSNQIKGAAMDALVASLPTVENGGFHVINTKDTNEGNICTKAQVAVAKGKGWKVYDYNGGNYPYPEYEGSDDAAGKLLLNAANFPDANFRAALASILGISEGDEITEEKIAATTSIDVSKSWDTPAEEKISNLTGVEHFTALKELRCSYNQLTSLDVSKNTALTDLACFSNQIKGAAMDALVASLPTVSKGFFYVIDTKDENEGNVCTKAQVAVAKEKGWTVYDYNDNNRQEYEGSDDAAAKLLLNAENFPDANFRKALASILEISEGDEITAEKIAATTSIDVSKSWNTPAEEKISNLTGVEHFTALTRLDCYNNKLTSLDVSQNTALTDLDCDENKLTSLDVSKNTALTELCCAYNRLTSLDVSKNTALTWLSCSFNQLTALDVSKNTALTVLECIDNNQLTALDVSKNTALTSLDCSYNQLISLDVSKNAALTWLDCSYNQLTSLDISGCTALTDLYCDNNQLTALDVSKNTALKGLECFSNQIKGEAMDALVASLPTVENGGFHVINTKDTNEGNVCTKAQVAIAKEKGWTVLDYNYDGINWIGPVEYEGSDPVEEDIDPVDEDDNIDFGTDMNDGDDLNGNVIGDIYYNINTGDGGYNATEGCIVVKKPTDDGTVNDLEGKDIFGEDFKSQFTGIVFKVPAGKGTIKVNAETTGNMLLKVKIGSNDPVEMELNGKLKVTFPYNVSETTLVYIYAGAANEAKGFGAPASGDAALKIYGIEFIRDNTPTKINAVDSGELTVDSWYTIDGKKLAGEPKEKGIYIYNRKKVVK